MSSVFGMNNIQLTGDSWEISDEFKLMCKYLTINRCHSISI